MGEQHTPHIISIGSCKGGVGKSTCALLCAVALSKYYKVGLLDADLYGSSILEIAGHQPQTASQNALTPINIGKIKCLSFSSMRSKGQPLMWRAPLLHKALTSMLSPQLWSNVDVLIIDLPPGTGDVPLTIAQKHALLGHMIITTPHPLAVQESLLFTQFCNRLSLKILGTIVNMSNLYTPDTSLQALLEMSPLIAEIPHMQQLSDATCTLDFIETCANTCALQMQAVRNVVSQEVGS